MSDGIHKPDPRVQAHTAQSYTPVTCQHCTRVVPPFYIVGDDHHSEAWCIRCVHNMEMTTRPEARPEVRRIKPEWSDR